MKFCSVVYVNYSVTAEEWEHRSKSYHKADIKTDARSLPLK
jgi:hypothetical protein